MDKRPAGPSRASAAERVRIVIADDDALLRACLIELIAGEPDLVVVGDTSDGEAAVRLVEDLRPDLLLLDLRLPGLDGVGVAKSLGARAADVAIVVITGAASAQDIVALLNAGVRGILPKDDVTFRSLLEDLRTITAGGE